MLNDIAGDPWQHNGAAGKQPRTGMNKVDASRGTHGSIKYGPIGFLFLNREL